MLLHRLSLLSALAWMVTLFWLSHQPSLSTPSLFEGQDKLFHAGAYGLLAMLLLAAHRMQAGGYRWREIRVSALIASLYGLSDEIHHAFVPGRSAEFADWLADTAGALLAALLLAWLSRRYARPVMTAG
jgi:VanZ family protein